MLSSPNTVVLPENCDKTIWGKLCTKFKKDAEFATKILPKATELEKMIKNNYATLDGKTNHKEIKEATDKIDTTNRMFKNVKKHRKGMTMDQKKEHDELIKKMGELQISLTNLKIPFNDQLTMGVLKAFLHRLSLQEKSYEYFIKHGLTKNDHNKFLKLNRVDDNSKIPDVTINGAEIGYPGIYLKKIKVEDELEAARAACLGRLTNCCQFLSGGVGEASVIHGLTSPYGGFYIVCKGDVNAPTIDDELCGQCWAWRSKSGAIVFDSIEVANGEIQVTKTFFEHFGKFLVEKGYTDKVVCGASSGISSQVGFESDINALEHFADCGDNIHCDSRYQQRVICDKRNPFYTFKEGLENPEIMLPIEFALQNKEPLDKDAYLVKSINWTLIENRQDYLTLLKKMAEEKGRLAEMIDLIDRIDSFVKQNNLAGISCFNNRKGADLDIKNSEGETPLILAVKRGLMDVCERLVSCGANIDETIRKREFALMHAVKGGNIKIACFLIESGANVNIMGPVDWGNIGSILHGAIENKHGALAIKLLDYNIDINIKDSFGRAPLFRAIQRIPEDPEFIKLALHLIEKGADVNALQGFGTSVLSTAIIVGNLEVCEKLIECGAKLSEEILSIVKSPEIKFMLENRIMKDLRDAMIEQISTESLEKSDGKIVLPSFQMQTNPHIQKIQAAKDLSELTILCKEMGCSSQKIGSLLAYAKALLEGITCDQKNPVLIKPVDVNDL